MISWYTIQLLGYWGMFGNLHIIIFGCQDGDFYKHPVCISGQAQWSKRLGGSWFEGFQNGWFIMDCPIQMDDLGVSFPNHEFGQIFSHNTSLGMNVEAIKIRRTSLPLRAPCPSTIEDWWIDANSIWWRREEWTGRGHVTGRTTAANTAFLLLSSLLNQVSKSSMGQFEIKASSHINYPFW